MRDNRAARNGSPPTRGWPRGLSPPRTVHQGSPAHAGMAPPGIAPAVTSSRFPRPRGDGPLFDHSAIGKALVPPPTRGWPFPMLPSAPLLPGSPAHAGMAPILTRVSARLSRFPAHAGMAPPVSWTVDIPKWFPRPRGDGPQHPLSTPRWPGVPPPTRGWPPRLRTIGRSVPGSPAHAGMAPHQRRKYGDSTGFPRPRGDGPALCSLKSRRAPVPPPTRGWPFAGGCEAGAGNGSPAHAGMAPISLLHSVTSSWFPRPRGDGPGLCPTRPPQPPVPPPTRGWPLRL